MRVTSLLLAAACLTLAGNANAEVLEIGKDGAVKRLSDQPNVGWISNESVGEVQDGAEVPSAAVTMVNERAVDGTYAAALNEVSQAYDISPRLLEALIWQESRWNQ